MFVGNRPVAGWEPGSSQSPTENAVQGATNKRQWRGRRAGAARDSVRSACSARSARGCRACGDDPRSAAAATTRKQWRQGSGAGESRGAGTLRACTRGASVVHAHKVVACPESGRGIQRPRHHVVGAGCRAAVRATPGEGGCCRTWAPGGQECWRRGTCVRRTAPVQTQDTLEWMPRVGGS